ncbi:MAG: transcriptional regulator [Microbacterium sp.]|nr:MAG: transcriptional regulator [Microbacterium sp.]
MAGAKRGPGPGRRAPGGPAKGRKPAAGKPGKPTNAKPRPKAPKPEPILPPPAETFTLGAVPGATPGKWIDIWNVRMPHTRLILEPIEVRGQRDALEQVDAALVRLPIDTAGLHVIRLYDEVPVVVTAADSHLTAADELDLADLAGEVLIVPQDDVLHLEVPGTVAPRFDAPATTEDAIATVASGVGIVIVPMSLARLHHRKDADYRPLRDARVSTVALAWDADRTTPEVETFVGIVRGRTDNSSR